MTVRPFHQRLLPLAGLALAAAASMSACGSDAPPTSNSSNTSNSDVDDAYEELGEVADSAGVPDECRDAFPTAVVRADIADVTPLPSEWPAPPVEATLCSTSSTMDDTVSILSYATSSSPAEVLDAYESALSENWEVTREDEGMGEGLTGTAGSSWFQVITREGAFDLTFGPA